MERIKTWATDHRSLWRLAWVVALLVLAACNNGSDGGGGGGAPAY
ncbi:MAG TPA: hypothetical protein VFW95_00950 [Candidatus Limnocylindria bacterium]|nr:hypothetical protein [Candidatus Limnocylindria bacterium]